MNIRKACILCEGMNINNFYTREAVAALNGKTVAGHGGVITTEEVDGKLCAFIDVDIPDIVFTCNARSGEGQLTVDKIISVDIGEIVRLR